MILQFFGKRLKPLKTTDGTRIDEPSFHFSAKHH
jgi:hypothetical protein